jgi:hypothetical protein
MLKHLQQLHWLPDQAAMDIDCQPVNPGAPLAAEANLDPFDTGCERTISRRQGAPGPSAAHDA